MQKNVQKKATWCNSRRASEEMRFRSGRDQGDARNTSGFQWGGMLRWLPGG